jgi:hypothetical protein
MRSKSLCIVLLSVTLLLGVVGDSANNNQAVGFVDVLKKISPKLSTTLCREILSRIQSEDIPLHLAIIWQESDFDSTLVCDRGRSHGYYQISLSEARSVDKSVTRADLLTLKNIELGSKYLDSLIEKYGLVNGLRRYNGFISGRYVYSRQIIKRKHIIEKITERKLTNG